jgi:hypothetical protein
MQNEEKGIVADDLQPFFILDFAFLILICVPLQSSTAFLAVGANGGIHHHPAGDSRRSGAVLDAGL